MPPDVLEVFPGSRSRFPGTGGHPFFSVTHNVVHRGESSAIMAANVAVSWSICGPPSIRCTSSSHDSGSRRTMPMRDRSMQRGDGSASTCSGSGPCPKRTCGSKHSGGSMTRLALTGHSRIEHQQNLLSGLQRIHPVSPP